MAVRGQKRYRIDAGVRPWREFITDRAAQATALYCTLRHEGRRSSGSVKSSAHAAGRPTYCSALPRTAERAEVRVTETRRIFQAVAEHAVEGDVGEPDQSYGQNKRVVLRPSNADKHKGKG